jgi:TPR repeat protein
MLGAGVPEDFVIAHKWLNLAGAQGDVEAGQLRMALTARMTPEQISEAQRLARDWYDAHREAAR